MSTSPALGALFVLGCAVYGVVPLLGQVMGEISGRVLDSSLAGIPKADVIVEDTSNGERRYTSTSSVGEYWLAGLPLGTYSVSISKTGFCTSVRDGVTVELGEVARADFVLPLATEFQSVDVEALSSREDSRAGSGETAFIRRKLMDLPINGRDYARLSLLAPGALPRTNQIADLSFNGMHTVHNQFSLDGIDATRVDQPYVANGLERGARLLTGSLDSITELRLVTNNYRAEYGRAAGAYINVATASGTNLFRGAAAYYLRNNWLDARNLFNVKPSPQTPLRYGDGVVSLSGPVLKNAMFFAANYEGSRQRIGVIGSGTVPSATLHQAARTTSPELAPVLAQMPAGISPTSNVWVSTYSTQRRLAVREDTASLKVNGRIGSSNSISVRLNWNDSRVRGPLFGSQPAALGLFDAQDVPIRTMNLAIFDQELISASLFNEFLAGMQRVRADLGTGYPDQPLIQVTGWTIQPGSRGRTRTANTRYQIGDSLVFMGGSHLFKAGANISQSRLVQMTSPSGLLNYASIPDFINNRAASATISGGNPGSATWGYDTGVFVQESRTLTPNLTLDYGVRHDYFAPPFDPQRRTATFDSSTGGLASVLSPYFSPNRRNFAPRIGAAWAFAPQLVLRTGYGLFFGAFPVGSGAIPGNVLPGNSTLLVQQIPNLSYPLTQFTFGMGALPKPSLSGFEWRKPDLYSQRWSSELIWSPGAGIAMDAAYTASHAVHLQRVQNMNLLDPKSVRRPYPEYSSINIQGANGNSSYEALQLGARGQRRRLKFLVSYTWSHAIDDVPDPAVYGSTQPQNGADLRAERGNGSGDSRHRISFACTYDFDIGRSLLLKGWVFAAVSWSRTGIAQTIFINANPFGNGNFLNQRPDAVLGANHYANHKTPDQWLNGAAFRMPAPGSFGNLGRNTVYGPGFTAIDVSLAKQTQFREHYSVRLSLQAFNVLNHPALSQPGNTFGTTAFGHIMSTIGNTIGFGTARQIQASAKIGF